MRRAVALSGLKKHEEARKAYLRATQIEPANAQLTDSMHAAAELAKREPEKNWEDDLWSDDEGEVPAAAASGNNKRASMDLPQDSMKVADGSTQHKRRKPDSRLQLKLRCVHSSWPC